MYKIWKASITQYRVQNTETGKTVVLENFILSNCSFKVDEMKYEAAKCNEFKNSGIVEDYFAWIEADKVFVKQGPLKDKKVFYNPYKSEWFRDRETGGILNKAKEVVIAGNTLSYE